MLKKTIKECVGTIVGSFFIAIAVSLLLLPNELSSGGFAGIGTIFYYLLNIPVGITILALNIPLFLFAIYKIGKLFFLKTVIGTVSLSFFIDILDKYPALTNEKILACVYGGILTGIGTAIILKSNSSTGGSDLLALIIKEYKPKIEVGKMLVIIDTVIVLSNMFFLKILKLGYIPQ